jgi:hypothetical protein
MSVLARLLRSLGGPAETPAPLAPRAPALPAEELSRRLDALEERLLKMHQLASFEFELSVGAEWRALLAQPRYGEPGRLERYGGKVWSQCDEDGILAEIFRRIGEGGRRFVEFGVANGRECNTLKLLVEGWRGLWMESSAQHCAEIRRVFAAPLAEGRLELKETSVTAENIEALLSGAAVVASGELDLLSIDIDGNDYHVLKSIRALRPRVIVVEYNGKFPPPMDVVPPYDPEHVWDGTDYAGASLQAIANLAARRGYRLVGTNVAGVNAFFVREDLAGGGRFAEGGAAALYNPARYWLTRGTPSGHPTGERFTYTSDAALGDALRNT